MWQKILLSIFTIAVVLISGIMPKAYLESTPSIEYVKPKYEVFSERINCQGVIEAVNISEIYLQTPVIASDILVSVGDYVETSDLLATINCDLTKSVLTGGEAVSVNMPISFDLSDISQIEEVYKMAEMAGVNLDDVISRYSASSYSPITKETPAYIAQNITAPISGIVSEVNIKSNMLCSNQKAVFTIIDTSKYKVTAQVSQSDIEKISIGDKAFITFNSSQYSGRVSKIYPMAKKGGVSSAGEAAVNVEFELLNPDERVKSGYNVNVEVVFEDDKEVFMLPFEAVMQDGDNQEYVYVLKGSQAVRKNIVPGEESSKGIEIISGISNDDIVVYKPTDSLNGQSTVYIKGEAVID